jgi:hypothetical protein
MELLQELDDIINNYLFDVELYASSSKEEDAKSLLDSMQKIHDGLPRLKIDDLQSLIRKYRKQHAELVDEREWREAREKPHNIPRALREKTVVELLRKIETLAKEKERLAAQLAANPPKQAVIEQRTITASSKRPPTVQIAKEKTVKLPETKPVRNTEHEIDSHDAWEEFSSATRTHADTSPLEEEPATKEGRIETMVGKFLQQRPQVDWRERDRQEQENRKARFRKEIEEKKKLEEWEETKKKTRTLPQHPHSRKPTPSNLPQQARKKKKWWMLGEE